MEEDARCVIRFRVEALAVTTVDNLRDVESDLTWVSGSILSSSVYLLTEFAPQLLNDVLGHPREIVRRFPVPLLPRCGIV